MNNLGVCTVAVELSEEEKSELLEKLEQSFGAGTEWKFNIDPSILGGYIAVSDERSVDCSIRTQLSQIEKLAMQTIEKRKDVKPIAGETLDSLLSGEAPETEEHINVKIQNDKYDEKKDKAQSPELIEPMDEQSRTIRSAISFYSAKAKVSGRGRVQRIGDGIALISGLDNSCIGELLEFDSGAYGFVMNLNQSGVGAVLLTSINNVSVGDGVTGTGHVLEVPVGEQLLGRVMNPLGMAIDGGDAIESTQYRVIEYPAPTIAQRAPVREPMHTGLLSIDAIVPIGRGQRELIIGDRQTGKTAIAVDTIINQKGKDVVCIYVAIGQKASSIARIENTLRQRGALDYTVMICATSSEASSMQYIAPYAGCAVAEYFMYKGRDVLIVYDDLSKHAVAYRTLSLLLHRPPGREAYPGDVFYLHSRLLERAAQLDEKSGGGSMTALPIIETLAGDISSYIPTNVISITDGQIVLDSELFHSGMRPALNIGLSVSRVGGAAQTKCLRKACGQIRLELAQYRELAVFAQFGSDLGADAKKLLAHGERLTETLKQSQYDPYSQAMQVIMLRTVSQTALDALPSRDIHEVFREVMDTINSQRPDILYNIEQDEYSEELFKEIDAIALQVIKRRQEAGNE